MNSNFDEACFKWMNVHLILESSSVDGTLFLSKPDSSNCVIQWIAGSNLSIPSEIPPINLNDLDSIERRHLVIGRRFFIIILRLKNGSFYGPLEFTQGGSTQFIERLRKFVDLKRSKTNENQYIVNPKTTYQLPHESNDQFVGVSTAIQQVGRRVLDSLNLLPSLDPFPSQRERMREKIDASLSSMNYNITCDRALLLQTDLTADEDAGYQVIRRGAKLPFIDVPELKLVKRQPPLSLETWERHLDRDGRVTVVHTLQEIIFNGGVEQNLRPIVWRYLLGLNKWDFTYAENSKRAEEKRQKYQIIKTFWKTMSSKQEKYCRFYRERTGIIEKDTFRTDRETSYFRDDTAGNLARLYDILVTYTFYNLDFGYFQGMNDLLAIIMTVIENEEDAFWCFAGLLERLEEHLSEGRFGIKDQFTQLFKLIEILMPKFADFLRQKDATYMNFCFKWFLILFKREFSYDDIKILWEALWSDMAPKNFHLLVAASILYGEMDKIMQTCEDISHILQYINNLSGTINVQITLSRAHGFYRQLLEVKDRLSSDIQITLGFIPRPEIDPADSSISFATGQILDVQEANFLLSGMQVPFSVEVGADLAEDVSVDDRFSVAASSSDLMTFNDPFSPGTANP